MKTSKIIDNLMDKDYATAEKNIKDVLYNKMADAIRNQYPSAQNEEPSPEPEEE